jgi:hypothetical protein
MNAKTILQAWASPSSRGVTTYQTVLYTDGSSSCDCPGWVYYRRHGERTCKHIRGLKREMTQRLIEEEQRPKPLSPAAAQLLRRGMFPEPSYADEPRPDIWRTEPPWEEDEAVVQDVTEEARAQEEPKSPEPEQLVEPEPYLSDTARRARLLRFD